MATIEGSEGQDSTLASAIEKKKRTPEQVSEEEVNRDAKLLGIGPAEARKRLEDPMGSILADWNKPGGHDYVISHMRDNLKTFDTDAAVDFKGLFQELMNDKEASGSDKFMAGMLIPMLRSIEILNLEAFSKLDARAIRRNQEILRGNDVEEMEEKFSLEEELKTKTYNEVKESLTAELGRLKNEVQPGENISVDTQEKVERSLRILRSLKMEAQRPLKKMNQSLREVYDDLWNMKEEGMTPTDLSLYAFFKNFTRDAEFELDDHLHAALSVGPEELERLVPQGVTKVGDIMRVTRDGDVITIEMHDKNGGNRHSYFLRKKNGRYILENASQLK